jgi:hypothetical protein
MQQRHVSKPMIGNPRQGVAACPMSHTPGVPTSGPYILDRRGCRCLWEDSKSPVFKKWMDDAACCKLVETCLLLWNGFLHLSG